MVFLTSLKIDIVYAIASVFITHLKHLMAVMFETSDEKKAAAVVSEVTNIVATECLRAVLDIFERWRFSLSRPPAKRPPPPSAVGEW